MTQLIGDSSLVRDGDVEDRAWLAFEQLTRKSRGAPAQPTTFVPDIHMSKEENSAMEVTVRAEMPLRTRWSTTCSPATEKLRFSS